MSSSAVMMASMEEKFIGGCKARDVPANLAKQIWDQVVEFAGYGFNKAHSAAYALLAYQTAFLKANHPVHFMASLLTSEKENTANVVKYISACRGMGIEDLLGFRWFPSASASPTSIRFSTTFCSSASSTRSA